jgi:hypothetical protein
MLIFLQTRGTDFDASAAGLRWQSRPLEIGLFSGFAGGIIFGGSNSVRIITDHLAFFVADRTRFHIVGDANNTKHHTNEINKPDKFN